MRRKILTTDINDIPFTNENTIGKKLLKKLMPEAA